MTSIDNKSGIKRTKNLLFTWVMSIFLLMVTWGCSSVQKAALMPSEISQLNSEAPEPEYRLGPGDKISIKFFYNPDLDDVVTIRPDGKISLQLVDDIEASGLTVKELDHRLTEAYAKVLKTSPDKYSLCVGDKIAVKSYYSEKLNDEVLIRPDGKISLLLIGEVRAAGLTPLELEKILNKKYASYIDQPDISVIVRSFHMPALTVTLRNAVSQRIYVGGEVKNPAVLPIQGRLRLVDAVIEAGGILNTGNPNSIFLIRNTGNQQSSLYVLDMNSVLMGKSPDIVLHPYDVVYVPKYGVSEAAVFLRRWYKLIPDQVMVNFPIYLNTQHIKNTNTLK